ncbi:MAG: trimeric intracellular cation channel family protein [Verrucomicrobiota bacterium]
MPTLVPIEFLAVVVSAIYGVLLATRQGMDVVGVFTVACAVAFGGGTLRDLFLDRQPLFWIAQPHYPVAVFAIALLSGPIMRMIRRIKPLLLLPDAVGMALFTMVGTSIAIEAGTTWFLAAILGTITGTFGGVLGDIICNQIPTLFRPAPLNATCAFSGAWSWLIARHAGLPEPYAIFLGLLLIVALRLASVRWNWQFPAVRQPPG